MQTVAAGPQLAGKPGWYRGVQREIGLSLQFIGGDLSSTIVPALLFVSAAWSSTARTPGEVARVVGVGNEAQRQRQTGHHQGPAVQVGQRAPLREADVRHPVVEVGAVGAEDGLPVLEPLRDHEARVEDRHRKHDQWEEQRHDGVRLPDSSGDRSCERTRPGLECQRHAGGGCLQRAVRARCHVLLRRGSGRAAPQGTHSDAQ